jgi:hypothetical protein
MRRYGFEFIKGSGADYNARNLIEAVFFGGIICFPFLTILNTQVTKNIGEVFLVVFFLYALFGLLIEILPKIGLSLSLLFSISITLFFSVKLLNELTKVKFETLNILNLILIIAYATFVSVVNTNLLRSHFSQKNDL